MLTGFFHGLLLLKKESKSTRKLTLYIHEGAKGGIDSSLWERVFCHILMVWVIRGRGRGRTQARITLPMREEVGFAGQCSCMWVKGVFA